MKTTLHLTTAAVALVLFATTSTFQARAAERQITVNPKDFPTFTVNKDTDKPADVATTEPGGQPKEKKPLVTKKVFDVEDDTDLKKEAASQQDDDTPAIAPEKKVVKKFKVDPQPEQAATTPDEQDDNEDVATSPDPGPAQLLNDEAKLVKKPAAEEPDDEATTDETEKDAAIAADKPEAVEDDVADTAEEPEAAPVKRKAPRIYYYASKQKSFEKHLDDSDVDHSEMEPAYDGHQQSYQPTYYDYSGASCNQSYSGY